ncbi:leucine-rich repeat domain-containing protein [Treponema pedis]|uniref:leucine-rich repeat domain-containing protein n=1 Tax=Treponema pedis TaxID=409322 RepID=UPI000494CB1D|nr:leucine-rich repeat domain-containing protein [Treponema pedis]
MTKSKVTTGLALIVLSAAAVLFTGCRNTAGGKPVDGAGSGGGGNSGAGGGGVLLDTAVLTLSSDKLDIKVKAVTADGSPVTVEGCTETELPSGTETELHAQGTRVTLKGKITELHCGGNQLTALNVQGLSALKELYCSGNKLNAAAFKQLFTGLPQREESDNAKCILYTEKTGVSEGNHTDFTAPPDLADAFNRAKTVKKWKMYKEDASGNWVEI